MKIPVLDFGDTPQVAYLPQQSVQALSEYPLVWMLAPPRARLLRSACRTPTTFGALESSRSSRQATRSLSSLQHRTLRYRKRKTFANPVTPAVRNTRSYLATVSRLRPRRDAVPIWLTPAARQSKNSSRQVTDSGQFLQAFMIFCSKIKRADAWCHQSGT